MDIERSSLRLGVPVSTRLFPTDTCRRDRECFPSVPWHFASVGDPDAGCLCPLSFGEVGNNACDFHWLPPEKDCGRGVALNWDELRGAGQAFVTAWIGDKGSHCGTTSPFDLHFWTCPVTTVGTESVES